MNRETELKYWNAFKVIVQKQKLSTGAICPVRKCKKHQAYTIYIGDSCRLSTLYETSCSKHLSLQVDKAIAYRDDFVKKQILKAKEREETAARELLAAV